ncbi:MAG: tRNA (adenosine(37)-N6)-dimethylallyltransferase MiaA [Balneolaceae bacterium]
MQVLNNPMIKRLMILGPTASGKSDLAIQLAMELGGEVISADSRQCYKKIDIGTAKPGPEDLNRVKHYNISQLELEESDSAARFLARAMDWEAEIQARGNVVFYAGGSTLHLQGIIQPFDPLPPSNPENIRGLQQQADSEGLESLLQELERVDPGYAKQIDGLNRHRLFRALDVWRQTGKPFSSFHRQNEPKPPDDLFVIGLHHPRKKLYERINRRTERMIEEGLIGETEAILAEGYSPDLQSLQTVGYRDVLQYLKGDVTRDQMIDNIKTATRRYAKRQLTWFRRWPFIHWLDADKQKTEELAETAKLNLAAKHKKG